MKKRYSAVQQLPACCVPACLQMIFNHRSLPAYSQEEIGNRLGLVVPEEVKNQFHGVAVSSTPPYGTRIDLPQYSLQTALNNLSVPLKVDFTFVDHILSAKHLKKILKGLSKKKDTDTIICLQSGTFTGEPANGNGHVVLFEAAGRKQVRCVDPKIAGRRHAKYQTLYKSMKKHGPANYAGLWVISSAKPSAKH